MIYSQTLNRQDFEGSHRAESLSYQRFTFFLYS